MDFPRQEGEGQREAENGVTEPGGAWRGFVDGGEDPRPGVQSAPSSWER